MDIPLVDLKAQCARFLLEFQAAIESCAENASFIGGPDHKAFEKEFADYCGGGHVALCGNGTDALTLTIMEALGPGDRESEIITVSHTFIATVEAIVRAGFKPVFVDVKPETGLMDPMLVRKAITHRTSAILPVHLYGQMCEMDRIMKIARKHSIRVIEDACQAHGAKFKGKGPGHWSNAACFSFFPAKNLGAWGDGGAVFSKNKDLIDRIKMLANHGRTEKYVHQHPGFNSRLDGLQAAILRVKLRHIEEWTQLRRDAAHEYTELLSHRRGISLFDTHPHAKHVHHLFVVQVKNRGVVMARLRSKGIQCGIHYPIPVHEQPAFSYLGYKPKDLPVTHDLCQKILSLPMCPEMAFMNKVDHVCATLLAAVNGKKK